MEPVEITADGVVLRPWHPGDAEAVRRACQDANVQRWTTIPVPYLREHAEGFVSKIAPAAWEEDTGAPLAVCDPATGELLGSCGLVRIDRAAAEAEIGYWTAPWARGRGVATAATRAVARWAVEEIGVRRVLIRAEVGNHVSTLVALRAGFTPEGIARLAGKSRDGTPVDLWTASYVAGDDPAPDLGPLPARRAATFAGEQPVLFAATPGGEIRLRALEERDLDGLVTGARDPGSVRWTTVPDPYTREDAESFALRYAPGVWRRGTGAVFGIGDPRDDAYAGIMELRLWAKDPAVADVGFVVAPHARGRGYAPAALLAVCAWGVTALGLTRIEWRANVGNTASRRVAEKAGFTFEGTARAALDHRGERVDAWVAALLDTDLLGTETVPGEDT